MNKFLEGLATKLGATFAIWIVSICMIALATTFTLGKAALDDNSAAMKQYSESNLELVKSVGEVRAMASELRKLSFKDGIRLLAKQSYKMDVDPDDIKFIDVAAASDFCASNLFKDFIASLDGSEKILIHGHCADADLWVHNN
jgi:hypothetical protein